MRVVLVGRVHLRFRFDTSDDRRHDAVRDKVFIHHVAVDAVPDADLLVLRLDFTSLCNGRRTLDYLDHLGISRERVRLVVNRYGQPKEIAPAKAEEALNLKIFHYVPDDPKTINRANTAIASAVEQQSAATQEIVQAVTHASTGTQEVTSNISGVAQAAEQTGAAATQVLASSSELAEQASHLDHEMDRFLSGVRTGT